MTQRSALLRIASTYRTASVEGPQVITGTLPINLMMEVKKRLHHQGNGVINGSIGKFIYKLIENWQRTWAIGYSLTFETIFNTTPRRVFTNMDW